MSMLDASLIADLPPFAGLRPQELDALLAQATSRRFARDAHVFRQGDEAKAFFVLLDGHIRVVKMKPDGEQVIARYIPNGELFGIAPAIGRTRYPANAVAAVDCLVLAWPTRIWDELMTAHPAFAANTHALVGDRLMDTLDRVVELATERVEQRVANAILKLARQSGKASEDGVLIDLPVSRQDISDMTGTTLHTVSRLMSGWESQGWIKSGRRRVTVVQDAPLLRIASGRR